MKRTIIIAEAGVNHNGDINTAMKLIDAAAEAGVDYVKFQTFKAEELVSKNAEMAQYQKENSRESISQYEMLRRLELSSDDHVTLLEYCSKRKVRFLSTAFDLLSIDLLVALGITLGKIPSGEITNLPYLQKMARCFDSLVLSTGMSTMDEIKDAISVLCSNGMSRDKITVLHCNTQYPTPMCDVNLGAMNHLRTELNIEVGYSDHTLGIEVPTAAVAMGASMIEKHFTLDRNLPGPDHKASLEPHELKAMVAAIRNIELAISGDGIKQMSRSEAKNLAVARKSIHTAHPIDAGQILSPMDLVMLRPGDAISPMLMNEIIGRAVKGPLPAMHKITWEDLA
jgi:N-acetylneuraminate synthase